MLRKRRKNILKRMVLMKFGSVLHLFVTKLHHYGNILVDMIRALNVSFAPLVGIFGIFGIFAILVSSAKRRDVGFAEQGVT